MTTVATTLGQLNSLDTGDAHAALLRLCGSTRWANAMTLDRPFDDADSFHASADRHFEELQDSDWLEAFSHHPRIGDVSQLRERFATTATWSEGEQVGISDADEAVIEALADANHRYDERYGHIFLVCATGKSAAEMLAILESRMHNTAEAELAIAAGEQQKITHLRIDKLLSEGVRT